jgi:hypothetical protein
MATFDQRGQHAGQQYNVAGDLHIGAAQPREADVARGMAGPPPEAARWQYRGMPQIRSHHNAG